MSILITIEGLDGTGKSTLAQGLVAEMQKDPAFYEWVYLSKEPGSSWTGVGPDIRKLVLETPDFRPFERELLFYVDASIHTRFINNQQSALIVSDRGHWSHLAYVRGYLKTKQIDYTDYELCKKLIDRTCAKPDCVIYLKGSVDLMKERLEGKKKDAIELNEDRFFSAVLETYEDLVINRKWDGQPLLVLDASATSSQNIIKVLEYLKEVFHERELREGNRELCRV